MIKLKGKKKSGIGKGYYDVLEVTPSSPTSEIRGSFERLVEENVDLNSNDLEIRRNSAETLYNLSKAYDVLTDPQQRINYDEKKFGENPPYNTQVETIFREGVKYFKLKDLDRAIRFLKEAVELMPHKVTYRINLAVAYYEKGLIEIAESELRTSLKLDPNNEFAQEMIAKFLFKVSDRKNVGFLSQKANRQLSLAVASIAILIGIVLVGTPHLAKVLKNISTQNSVKQAEEKYKNIENQLPADMRKYLDDKKSKEQTQSQSNVQSSIINIPKLDDSFVAQGSPKDYTAEVPIKKTYYESQGIVVVTCSDGSILTYKLGEVIGWKMDKAKNIPVIITKNNEIIPIPTNIPVTLADGKVLNPDQADFPKFAFPEYSASKTDTSVEQKEETPKEEVKTDVKDDTKTEVTDDKDKQENAQDSPTPSESASASATETEASINPSEQTTNDKEKPDSMNFILKDKDKKTKNDNTIGLPSDGNTSKNTLPIGNITNNESNGK